MENACADILALQFGPELQQHRRTRFQNVAILREPLGEQHGLEMAGGIRETHDAHLVAGLGAPFHARHHGRGDLSCGGAGFHRAGEFGPGLHPQPLQHGRVIVERMAGQKEADRVIFAPQPLGRQPRLDLRQHDGRRVGRVAEHVVLADASPPRGCAGRRRGSHPRRQTRAPGLPPARRRRRRPPGLSTMRLLMARGLTRAAKSASDVKSPLLAVPRRSARSPAGRRPSTRQAHNRWCRRQPRSSRPID